MIDWWYNLRLIIKERAAVVNTLLTLTILNIITNTYISLDNINLHHYTLINKQNVKISQIFEIIMIYGHKSQTL